MHTPWIRLRGDLEFRKLKKKKHYVAHMKMLTLYSHLTSVNFAGNENYETAMASYVSAIITGSEYCTMNIQRQTDDYIIRRMIKCSSNLGCYLQAAILCQVSCFGNILNVENFHQAFF